MKSMFHIFVAAVVGAAALTACGGGSDKTPVTAPIPVQPAYKLTETKVGTTGDAAAAGDTVVFNYVGYVYDATKDGGKGAKVDSTIDSGRPRSGVVGVGQLIGVGQVQGTTTSVGIALTGWDMALLGMKAGGTRSAILPANLAYGAYAFSPLPTVNGNVYAAIPANTPLIYDFEMISVTKAVIIPNVPASGNLEVTDTAPGTGDGAVAGKTLTVNYRLYLYDGTRANRRGPLVESSLDGTFNFVLGAGKVIPGWDQGFVGMKAGGSRTLQVPPALGYGATAQLDASGGLKIPANSTLIFDTQLVSIK